MDNLKIRIRIKRPLFLWSAAGLLFVGAAAELATETLTLTTSFPAPSALYARMIVTADAYLARDGGKVGIGTTNPAAALDVAGTFRLQDGSQTLGGVLTSDANGTASWSHAAGLFGGIFYTADSPSGTCLSGNPFIILAGQCRCPPGFTDRSFRLFTGSGYQWSAGYTCYVPCMGQFIYLHQCL